MCINRGDLSDDVGVDVQDVARPAPSPELVQQLVDASHILYDQGVLDAFGHVSVRHDAQPDRFLLARNMAPGQVKAEDIIEFTLDSQAVSAASRRVYLERFIHGEIYRRRADVVAVVHSHSHAILPFSVVKAQSLRALIHTAGFMARPTPIFEIRDVRGDGTDLLISDNALGRALAERFDDSDIVLMRGHGSTVVGTSLPQVVFRAVYAERNARYQLEALRLGDVTYLTRAEGEACVAHIDPQVQRPWDLWVEEARGRRAR